MYAICDVRWHLSDAFCFQGSEAESLAAFAAYYPPPRSVLVYRVDGKDHGSFIFVDHISSRRYKRLTEGFIGCNCQKAVRRLLEGVVNLPRKEVFNAFQGCSGNNFPR